MEESILYDLLEKRYLYDYREELAKEEGDNLSKWVRESREALEKSLNSEQLKLVDKYKHSLILREGDIELQTSIKLLNYGVKIGMELQKAFDKEKQ